MNHKKMVTQNWSSQMQETIRDRQYEMEVKDWDS
jgi:hypothetical protein